MLFHKLNFLLDLKEKKQKEIFYHIKNLKKLVKNYMMKEIKNIQKLKIMI